MMGELILRNLLHRPLRTLIGAMGIAVEVALVVLIVGLTSGLLTETAKRIEGIGADIMLLPANSSIFFAFGSAPMPIKIDRKSTRLNSSHQIISYAVFCLTLPAPPRARLFPYRRSSDLTLIGAMGIAVEVALVVLIVGLTSGLLTETAKRIEGIGADIMLLPANSSIFFAFGSAPMPIK